MITRILPGFVKRFVERLRFPTFFFITAAAFVLDLFVPDLIPFADELLLGLGTMMLARWKKRKAADRIDNHA